MLGLGIGVIIMFLVMVVEDIIDSSSSVVSVFIVRIFFCGFSGVKVIIVFELDVLLN